MRNPRIPQGRQKGKPTIGLPPLQRVKRAPGEVNPRKGKRGGLTRRGRMIE